METEPIPAHFPCFLLGTTICEDELAFNYG